jgi:hypothetical protein
MNFYYFLSYLSAIDLNHLTCVNKSYNIMISSNDRLYQDLYEKYFNKIKINSNVKEEKEVVVEVEQEVKEESISYKTLFERIYKDLLLKKTRSPRWPDRCEIYIT